MSTFGISLDSNTNVFFPNSEVNGTVYLNTNEIHNLKRISVTIIGCAYVYYEGDLYNPLPFEAVKFYISVNTILWEYDGFNKLSNGQHGFPFKFVIPSNAPANIREKFGDIQYHVKASCEFYGNKKTQVQYCGFPVCPIIDLNLDPKLKLPASTFVTKTEKKCFSSAEKLLTVKISLPKSGFVCGELIPLQIDICNETSIRIKSLEYGILLKSVYTGRIMEAYLELSETEILSTEKSVNIVNYSFKPRSSSAIYSIPIPPLTPSFMECPILKIQYFVFVKVHTNSLFESDLSTSLPITVGTVPLNAEGSDDDTVSATTKILETADFVENLTRFKIKENKRQGPTYFRPKFPYFSKMSDADKLSSE